ncbi:MAG: cation transporter [Bacteroidetes bacterium SW_9_63_38]|nr:MAG: cation transporter [Bacteroidetes bacterium SW_9_63_38]
MSVWVFGYGSLMWDGWEQSFEGERVEGAELHGYRRAFNKKSVENWGTRDQPCPTLGLEEAPDASCTGVAFQFSEEKREAVWRYLRDREGPSFDLETAPVCGPDGRTVSALVAINDPSAASYIGETDLEDRAAMIRGTQGTAGTCLNYLRKTRKKLRGLSIEDTAVEAFWTAVVRRK